MIHKLTNDPSQVSTVTMPEPAPAPATKAGGGGKAGRGGGIPTGTAKLELQDRKWTVEFQVWGVRAAVLEVANNVCACIA